MSYNIVNLMKCQYCCPDVANSHCLAPAYFRDSAGILPNHCVPRSLKLCLNYWSSMAVKTGREFFYDALTKPRTQWDVASLDKLC